MGILNILKILIMSSYSRIEPDSAVLVLGVASGLCSLPLPITTASDIIQALCENTHLITLYYEIINSANIKKIYRYWLNFFILAEFVILYCKDSLGCIDNNNITLINNTYY
jgi:hypothetical protein